MSSTLLRPYTNKRPSSRNGRESPSAATHSQNVGRSTSRTGLRTPTANAAPHNSQLNVDQPTFSEQFNKHKRRLSFNNSANGITDGVGNVNRWSQSTVSSKSSATPHQRRSSFAKRLSGSFSGLGTFNPQQSPQKNTTFRKPSSPTRPTAKMDPMPHNTKQPESMGPPSSRLPPVATLPSLTQAVESAKTPQYYEPDNLKTPDLLPTATYMPGNGDYFGAQWENMSPHRSKPRASERVPTHVGLVTTATDHRINPGAKNSFASTSPSRTTRVAPPSARTIPRDETSSPKLGYTRGREGGGDAEQSRNGAGPSANGQQRERRRPSQKAMLAKALEKANTAVVLDNAQNFEGALGAYKDACNLLQHVMLRSAGDDDKRKLETIRSTYRARILELNSTEVTATQPIADKPLPEAPKSPLESQEMEPFSPLSEEDDQEPVIGGFDRGEHIQSSTAAPRVLPRDQIPPRRQSLMRRNLSSEDVSTSMAKKPLDNSSLHESNMLNVPMDKSYMPPPLSPRRPHSPMKHEPPREASRSPRPEGQNPGHTRQETAESTSWLDTIDESGGSSNSSVHSRSSFQGVLRRKHIRTGSGDTEAEFDAALDAAVEAAYDEGYEPASDDEGRFNYEDATSSKDRVSYMTKIRQDVDRAKQRVRDAEREQALAFGEEHDMGRFLDPSKNDTQGYDDLDDSEAEEEERLLEGLTREYVMDDREYGFGNKSAVPRESGSSGFSGRTWGSSVGSMPTTNASITPLSTVAETSSSSQPPPVPTTVQKKPLVSQPPSNPPPAVPRAPTNSRIDLLPPPIPKSSPPGPPLAALPSPGVRDRRLSGQKQIKQLKIDTGAKLPAGMNAPKTQPPSKLGTLSSIKQADEPPKSASLVRDGQLDLPSSTLKQTFFINSGNSRNVSSPFPGASASPSEPTSGMSDPPPTTTKIFENQTTVAPASPVRSKAPSLLRKNFSSSSLKSLRQPLATPPAEDSPSTPLSKVFSSSSITNRGPAVPSVPDLPTPSIANFAKAGNTTGNMSFFDSDIHSPHAPGSPNPLAKDGPAPLEPCPESFLLRPFWLMRAIHQTIMHPRGGYLSNRLFVPRDIWRVRNVKLKNIDDKIGALDLLTAALSNLSTVDNFDADRVLDEIQAFELTLDSVQGTLGKKLGAEVGSQSVAAFVKASPSADEPGMANDLASARTPNMAKSYFGKMRLGRSKASFGPGAPSIGGSMGMSKDALTMKSLPMTSTVLPPSRSSMKGKEKDRAASLVGIGPHAHYMAALARLCEAVQVLDQIARQVEDPGLKFSSQAHVGLELSIRHAAEFFAFYICRFALNDIGMMVDKFVKRGSEWVNS